MIELQNKPDCNRLPSLLIWLLKLIMRGMAI